MKRHDKRFKPTHGIIGFGKVIGTVLPNASGLVD